MHIVQAIAGDLLGERVEIAGVKGNDLILGAGKFDAAGGLAYGNGHGTGIAVTRSIYGGVRNGDFAGIVGLCDKGDLGQSGFKDAAAIVIFGGLRNLLVVGPVGVVIVERAAAGGGEREGHIVELVSVDLGTCAVKLGLIKGNRAAGGHGAGDVGG